MLWEVNNSSLFIEFTTFDRLTQHGLLLKELFKFLRRHYEMNYVEVTKCEHRFDLVDIDILKKVLKLI